ncbi:TIGR03986 family type III CRISPR-associated RAMP protein [Vibrio sp. PNB22_8_1]|uniref:TIGR03986 family type III CRISPR-associated RAMP protein n=1 Tax=unclassified Vibrio TaxID=2614977 RepID=UPI00406AA97D
MNAKVHTPYHFVPLSKWVYMPDWAHLVSHDVPFKDGLSGVLEYTLTNHTPLCVGTEQLDQDDGSHIVKFARNPESQLIIPGSSIKGMIRSTLEISTFGKFNHFDDYRLSFRDMSNAKNNYLGNIIKQHPPQAGWLRFDVLQQVWTFTPCQCVKVSHSDMKHQLNVSIKNDSSAVDKYRSWPLSKAVSATISEPRGKQKNCWAESLGIGNVSGNFVFTNYRVVGRGSSKDYEFSYFFYDRENAKPYGQDVAQQAIDLFANHGEEQVEYLKHYAHPEKGIPVFALVKKGKVHSFGFAKTPRVSYKNTTKNLVDVQNRAHTDEQVFDMAELMFGTLREKGLSLKGRVTFADVVASSTSVDDLYRSELLVLNSPKPSFFPAYIEQIVGHSGYADYDNEKPISGHKRYIAKKPNQDTLTSNVVGSNRKVAGVLEMCKVGTEFVGQVYFHNLKPLELGALLWSMRLESQSYHQLGHGKPMGAGAVSIVPSIKLLRGNDGVVDISCDALVSDFVAHMESTHPAQQWRRSPQLEYLLKIGELDANVDVDTRYMDIDKKDFQNAKNRGEKLPLLHDIPRSEPNVPYGQDKVPSLAFASGRLSILFDSSDTWSLGVVEAKERCISAEEEAREALRRERERENMQASMSQHAWKVEELKLQLEKLDASERPPILRETVKFFCENVVKGEAQSCLAMYQLARSYDFHKTPKKRKDEQKKLLNTMLELYGVTV